jgi:enamine deaminase RidA (YjgF/YER057c/UK114 family)
MAKIEQYAAREVFDPPIYAQAVKVTGAETILYLSGQVAYDVNGAAAHPGDFKAQARAAVQAVQARGGTMANIVKVNTYRSSWPSHRRGRGGSAAARGRA